jgi:cysteine synthase A
MSRKGRSILDFLGDTPIVKVQNIHSEGAADVYLKLEEFNPGGSIKARIALRMIIDAEEKGFFKHNSGQTIIEPTGGNTGIGLAMVGAVRGYKVILVVPDNYSREKIEILKVYGAKVILSDSKKGNDSHIEMVKEIIKEHPGYIWLNQFANMSNPKVHYETTGKEIIEALEKVDCFVAGVGTGGTITGVGKRIKEKFPDALIVGVQPVGCDVLKGKAIPHRIQGLAIGMLPPILDVNIVDKVVSIKYEEAVEYMKDLASKEGLLTGISSGANVCAAIKMAKELGEGKTVVTVAPDSGRSYLEVFDGNNNLKEVTI